MQMCKCLTMLILNNKDSRMVSYPATTHEYGKNICLGYESQSHNLKLNLLLYFYNLL